MARLLVLCEHSFEASTLASFAKQLSLEFDLLVLSGDARESYGESRLLTANLNPIPPADALVAGLAPLARDYDVIAASSTMFGKDYLPRLAATLDRPMISDATKVVDSNSFERPMYAGNVTAIVRPTVPQYLVSVRSSSFPACSPSGTRDSESVSLNCEGSARRTHVGAAKAARPELSQAAMVVSGGRPLKDAETFERLIGGLADALGGAAGATRAAVDSGIAPNELQVGQTGKIVAPNLYIAAGISGSTQHIAGMKESKTIVAINTDPDAPIFEVADYGLVQDLFVAVPELISKVRH